MNSETIDSYIDQVIKDLQTAAKYPVSDTERDELRITGRMCVDLTAFASYLKPIQAFLRSHPDAVWQLSLNVVSCDVEISLKNTLISL